MVFKHQYITAPTVTKADAILAVTNKLTQVQEGETETNIGATEKQKLTQLVKKFQTVATNCSKKDAEKPSQAINNSTTQTRVANANTEKWIQKQKSINESQTAEELTKTMPAIKEKVVVSPNKNKQRPNIISQEEDDKEEASTCPADNTRGKRANTMLTQECAMATIQISQDYFTTCDQEPREVAGAIVDRETGEMLKYRHLKAHLKYQDTWKKSYGNEIGRIAQGMPG